MDSKGTGTGIGTHARLCHPRIRAQIHRTKHCHWTLPQALVPGHAEPRSRLAPTEVPFVPLRLCAVPPAAPNQSDAGNSKKSSIHWHHPADVTWQQAIRVISTGAHVTAWGPWTSIGPPWRSATKDDDGRSNLVPGPGRQVPRLR